MSINKKMIALVSALLLLFGSTAWADTVAQDSTVVAELTMQLRDGTVVATTDGGEPVTFQVGQTGMLPAIQEGVTGMSPGESKEIVLTPEQAFGQGNPEAVKKVPNTNVPDELREVGKTLAVEAEGGKKLQGRVVEVGENNTTLDFNHPLAGRTLVVKVKVLEVR